MSTSRQTPLHDIHLAAGAQMDDIDGWTRPRRFGAVEDEHAAVRREAGVFDLSHRFAVDVDGEAALGWLRELLANDVGRLDEGEASYGCLCDERGGVVDDLIACRLGEGRWRLIGNAGSRERVLARLGVAEPGAALSDGAAAGESPDADGPDAGGSETAFAGAVASERPDGPSPRRPDSVGVTASADAVTFAVQGPAAVELAARALAAVREDAVELARLEHLAVTEADGLFVLRTADTGEDGVEIRLPEATAPALWSALLEAGVRPCGHDAHEVLRIEAGTCRMGHELDPSRTPVESGLGRTVDLSDPERAFAGRETIEDQLRFGGCGALVGLVYEGEGRREMRAGQSVQLAGRDVGTISSAAFSPVLERSVALALVERPFRGNCDVVIDAHPFPAATAVTPFVRGGGTDD